MKFRRRELLKWSVASTLFSGLPQTLKAESEAQAEFETRSKSGPSILQGATDGTSTQFSIVVPNDAQLNIFTIFENQNIIIPDLIEELVRPGQKDKIIKVYFSNLQLNVDYQLILSDSATGEEVDRRFYNTLDVSRDDLKFALCSCMEEKRHEPEIWRNLVNDKPDMIFFLGDSVYVDKSGRRESGPDRLWRRFSESRRVLEIYYSERLIPVFATWDDHDFGENDSGSSYKWVKESQVNFLSFFAQEESHCQLLQRGPGVSSAVQVNGFLFLLMDDRSYRLRSGSKERYAHWGEEQELWAMGIIDQWQGPVFLANGSQIFPTVFWKESFYRDHKNNFKQLIETLKGKSNPIVFLSGDVHYSEISEIEEEQLGYKTYELTSSSIHSPVMPGFPTLVPNHRRIAATGKRNYLLVEAKMNGTQLDLEVVSRSKEDSTRFKKSLSIGNEV